VETEASYKRGGNIFDTNGIAQHSEYCILSIAMVRLAIQQEMRNEYKI